MKRYILILSVGITLLFTGSCIEPFLPEIKEYEDNLVVEGNVLEGKGPSSVRLSRSFAFDENNPQMISDAEVRIRDDQGQEINLEEFEEGVYLSDTSQFEGMPGRSYQLYIQLPDGKQYESDWMLMKAGVPISDISAEVEARIDNEGPVSGVIFSLDAVDTENKSRYYRWEYEETWQFSVPYPAKGIWNPQSATPNYYAPEEIPATCWRTEYSSEILIHTTTGLTEDRVVKFPVRYVSERGNHLVQKYSILVRQYVLTAETYEYWRSLKEITDDPGTLFDPVPTELISNVRNIDDPGEQVLGFFSADGFSRKRIFARRQDFTDLAVNTGYRDCMRDTLDTHFDMSVYVNMNGVYVENLVGITGATIGYIGTTKRCADCRTAGTMEKPDFWE